METVGVQPLRLPLEIALGPFDVLRILRDEHLPFLLTGMWYDGDVVLGMNPVRVLSSIDHDVVEGVGGLAPITGLDERFVGGGWVGYLGYQLARQIERIPAPPAAAANGMVDGWFGYYDHILRRDGESGRWAFEALATPAREVHLRDTYQRIASQLAKSSARTVRYTCSPFEVVPSPDEHRAAVSRAIDYIHAGDIFQANITLRLEATFEGDPIDFFCAGAEQLHPAYAAYISTDTGVVCSFSPELFLRRRGRRIETSPIKGTAARGSDLGQAEVERENLVRSAKNRAENVMIVDLMRNDLSRVCVPGTVLVPDLLRPEPHPGVWHLVSDVRGTLREGVSDSDLIRATFPPGSVTGAPKVRALEIINEVESGPRAVYTGAVGMLSPSIGLTLNVGIRTFEFVGHRVTLGVGGGIVADSLPEAEYEECLLKALPLLAAVGATISSATSTHSHQKYRVPAPAGGIFETLLVVDREAAWLHLHLDRLARSAFSLYGTELPAKLEHEIQVAACGWSEGMGRMRVSVRPAGGQLRADIEIKAAPGYLQAVDLQPANLPGGLGAHKWLDRRGLASLRSDLLTDAVHIEQEWLLLVDGEDVLEADRGNLFARWGSTLVTPPTDGRLLPGIMRDAIIRIGSRSGYKIKVENLSLDRLGTADEVFVCNALRGIVSVRSCAAVGAWRPSAWQAAPALRAALDAHSRTLRDARPTFRARPLRKIAPAIYPRPVVLVDNFDSFAYNLVHYLQSAGADVTVFRNDEITVDDLKTMDPLAVVLSPGPCSPSESGVSREIPLALASVPLLGVCLGHQCIVEAFGGAVVRADSPAHGKVASVTHDGQSIFAHLPSPLTVMRYHSLVVDASSVPTSLQISAWTADGIVMGVRHRTEPVVGVQFHPESILTQEGHAMVRTFVKLARLRRGLQPVSAS